MFFVGKKRHMFYRSPRFNIAVLWKNFNFNYWSWPSHRPCGYLSRTQFYPCPRKTNPAKYHKNSDPTLWIIMSPNESVLIVHHTLTYKFQTHLFSMNCTNIPITGLIEEGRVIQPRTYNFSPRWINDYEQSNKPLKYMLEWCRILQKLSFLEVMTCKRKV